MSVAYRELEWLNLSLCIAVRIVWQPELDRHPHSFQCAPLCPQQSSHQHQTLWPPFFEAQPFTTSLQLLSFKSLAFALQFFSALGPLFLAMLNVIKMQKAARWSGHQP